MIISYYWQHFFLTIKTNKLKKVLNHISDDLLVKFLLNEANNEEKKVVDDWIHADSKNITYFIQLVKIWETSKTLAIHSSIDEYTAWEQFQKRIKKEDVSKKMGLLQRFLSNKIAASFLLILGATIITLLVFKWSDDNTKIISKTTNNILVDTLPDGSLITLNSKSEILYSKEFKKSTREVTIKGEAFFKIAPDKNVPFIITVDNIKVIVVGTSFNIKSDHFNTEILVETGIVNVIQGNKSIQLFAGEKLLISSQNKKIIKSRVTDKLHDYYRTKQFICNDTPLWKLVDVLNKVFNKNIVIGRDNLKDVKINSTFNNESLDRILEIIHITLDAEIVRSEQAIILQ